MTKSKLSALAVALVVLGLAIVRTATASHVASHIAFSGGSGFKGQVVKTESENVSVTTAIPTWQTIDSRGFQIPPGESQLVVVRFSATVACADDGIGAECLARVLIGRSLDDASELAPGVAVLVRSEDIAIGHAPQMLRALCVRNPTASPLDVSVWLQATKVDGSLDLYQIWDYALEITRNAECTPAVAV